MFILNFQKLNDNELKTDTNFNLVYQSLLNSHQELKKAALIGVAQKPLSLGYVYHVFMRYPSGIIVRAEVYLELFSLKVTVKSFNPEDFKSGLIALNQEDKSIKKIVSVIEKQANHPVLKDSAYSVQSVRGKDFLFGKFFLFTIVKDGQNYVAYVYHDQSS